MEERIGCELSEPSGVCGSNQKAGRRSVIHTCSVRRGLVALKIRTIFHVVSTG